VIIDVYARIRPPRTKNADPYQEEYAVLGELRTLAERYHVLILVIHHTRKSRAEDVFDELLGSMGIAAAADTLLVLARSRGEAEATLHITGREIEHEGSYALRFDAVTGNWQMIGDAKEHTLSQQRRAILDVLPEDAVQALSPQEIAERLPETRRGSVRFLLHRMMKDADTTLRSTNDNRYYRAANSPNSANIPHETPGQVGAHVPVRAVRGDVESPNSPHSQAEPLPIWTEDRPVSPVSPVSPVRASLNGRGPLQHAEEETTAPPADCIDPIGHVPWHRRVEGLGWVCIAAACTTTAIARAVH
jgi:hypothetical protein